jgi:hypothetical protein
VQLLNYSAKDNELPKEHELTIHKVLCGLKPTERVDSFSTITDGEEDNCNRLLKAIIEHWTPLMNILFDGLRTTFLQREEKLEEDEEDYFLGMIPFYFFEVIFRIGVDLISNIK